MPKGSKNQALRDAFDSLSELHVVLFGGKGGVGKTTISTLAALHVARKRPTILFTTDPASNLGDLLGSSAIRNLTIEALDAEALYALFLKRNLPSFLELGDRGTYLDREEVKRFFELSLPGIDELMAWSRIGELAEANSDALIVVDTAPTGHTLRMLRSAEHFREVGGALEAMQAKHRDIVRQLTRRDVRDALDQFIDDFEAEASRRREMLQDPKRSAFVPVLMAEPWIIDQTLRLMEEVAAEGLTIQLAILNRTASECDCPRCRASAARESEAAKRLSVRTVSAPRSCSPLDSADRLLAYLDGKAERKAKRATHNASPDRGELSQPPPEPLPRIVQSMVVPTDARLLFFAGKGGVGKTTCSSSLALQLARRHPSERFTFISVDPAHSVRDVFASEKPPENLTVEMIDTPQKWLQFRESIGREIERAVAALAPKGMTVAYDAEAMEKLIEIAPPGADELFAVSRLSDLLADPAQRRIIVDTAPTGHFLRLIDLPRSAGEWVHEFMRILLRYRELIPSGSLGEELIRASRSLHALSDALRSEKTAVFVVTRPERIVLAETSRLIDELKGRQIPMSGVIANCVTPDNDCRCDRIARGWELAELTGLGSAVVLIERRDDAVTQLGAIEGLLPIAEPPSVG